MKAFDIKNLPSVKEEVLEEYYKQRFVRYSDIKIQNLTNDEKFMENKDNLYTIDSILPE